jgi:hypothetical protein
LEKAGIFTHRTGGITDHQEQAFSLQALLDMTEKQFAPQAEALD